MMKKTTTNSSEIKFFGKIKDKNDIENENNSMTNMKKIMKMKKGRMMHKTLKKSTMLCTVMSEVLLS